MKENRRSVKDLAYGGLFTALIAAGAFLKITIPVQPVPMHFTLQFFFVLLAGLLLGSKGALFSVCTYLAVGLLGIPVFASGGGLSYLLKPTFGFLMGFAAAGYLTGRIHELHRQNSFGWLLFSAVWGLIADYACGMVWFYVCSNYVLQAAVSWKLVFINCFLLRRAVIIKYRFFTVKGDLYSVSSGFSVCRDLKPDRCEAVIISFEFSTFEFTSGGVCKCEKKRCAFYRFQI